MIEEKYYKAINFDLDTRRLKEYYPDKKNWRAAYKDIKNFFKENDFNHKQWSGYISNSPLTDMEILITAQQLKSNFPWTEQCIRSFDVTNIGEQHDLKHIFEGSEAKVKTINLEDRKSLDDVLKEAKQTVDKINAGRALKLHKNKDEPSL